MALTIVKNLTDISLCEANTNWSGAPTAGTTLVREGTNSLGIQVSNTTVNTVYSGAEISGGVNMTGKRIYAWVNVAGVLDTIANGGLGIIIGDATHQRGYYLAGKDTLSTLFSAAGWYCLVLDCDNLPTTFAQVAGANAPTITAITRVGLRIKTTAKAQGTALNFFWDAVRYGTGLTVYGGSSSAPGTFDEIAADDESVATGKAYGIIRKIQPGVFGIQGDLIFGDSAGTNSLYFKDRNSVVIVEDHVIGPGTPSIIQIKQVGNGTGSDQRFELGLAVSSGDAEKGSEGVTFLNANLEQPVTFDASHANAKHCMLYGCTFRKFKYTSDPSIVFSSDATNGGNHHVSGCTFDACGMVDTGRTVHRNNIFSNSFGVGSGGKSAAMDWVANNSVKFCTYLNNLITLDKAWQEDNSGASFVDLTSALNNSTATDAQPFPTGAGSNDAVYFGFRNKFSTLRANVGTAGAGTYTVAWEFWNGSAWTAVSGLSDGTTAFKTSGENLVSYTLPLTWVKTTVSTSSSLYWLRARRDAGTVTTDPVLTQAWVKKSHGVRHNTAGTFAYSTMVFTSNEKDLWFSAAASDLVINADATSSPGSYTNDSSGTVTINNSKTYTLTNLVAGSEVRIYRVSDDVELDGVESSTTSFGYSYNYAGDVAIYIIIQKTDYQWLRLNDTLTSTDVSRVVSQRVDRDYVNP